MGVWSCYERFYQSSKRKIFRYNVSHDGIYAVIFLPDLETSEFREEVYCGIFCRDKKRIFVFMVIIFPSLLMIFYIFYKL